MKSYALNKTKAKREVQDRLFKYFNKIINPKLTALAGSSPSIALACYSKYVDDITLVDINPVQPNVKRDT